MPTRTGYEHGTPSWVDLMSPDVDTSLAFYTKLFGWDAEDQHDDEGNRVYVMLRQDGHDVAGLGGQPPQMEGAPPVWNSYVSVDDVDAITDKVQAAGGAVMMPGMDVMTSGRMAVYADPTGAAFSVWQPREHIGAELVNEPNAYCWSELLTRDVDTATRFYTEVFGWEYDGMDMGDGAGTYHVVRGGEQGRLAGIMPMPPGVPDRAPNHWNVYFMVADIDAMLETVGQLGGQIVSGPMDVPGVGRMAMVHDPQYGSFSMMQPPSG